MNILISLSLLIVQILSSETSGQTEPPTIDALPEEICSDINSSLINNNCECNTGFFLGDDNKCYKSAYIKISEQKFKKQTNNAYYIYGETSNNCDSISVTAENPASPINDFYTLTDYKRGDITFKYGIREDWNNLWDGNNNYYFVAKCDGNQYLQDQITFNYYSTPEPKPIYIPIVDPKPIYIPTPYSFNSSVIETYIDGDFEGWEGETIFKMEDGSIWQQDSYDYTYHYAYRPEVLIYNKNGSYYMKVEDVDDTIRVVRLK